MEPKAAIRRAYLIGKKRGHRKGFREGWNAAYKFINDLTILWNDEEKKNEKVR
jgi:hypothetical protein